MFNHFEQVWQGCVCITKGTQYLASLGNSCSSEDEKRLNADEDQTRLTSLEVVGEGQKNVDRAVQESNKAFVCAARQRFYMLSMKLIGIYFTSRAVNCKTNHALETTQRKTFKLEYAWKEKDDSMGKTLSMIYLILVLRSTRLSASSDQIQGLDS